MSYKLYPNCSRHAELVSASHPKGRRMFGMLKQVQHDELNIALSIITYNS